MRFLFHLLLMSAVALAVGIGLTWLSLNDGRVIGAYRVGPWVAWPDDGVAAPNPYTRAHLARAGVLQLGQSEGLTFIAEADSAGRVLTTRCSYLVAGPTPTSTFWTLSATDLSGRNIVRGADLAMNSSRLVRAPDGTATITVGRRLAPGNWLEINARGLFALTLNLYDTQALSGVGDALSALPSITRQGCT